ncbi:MAG: hypothetical protein HYT63_03790 [Candidatus Yanofskybacteria bacterium]|nr:hypothetical protein [Candidatus Yanofskybacteria bacterium]
MLLLAFLVATIGLVMFFYGLVIVVITLVLSPGADTGNKMIVLVRALILILVGYVVCGYAGSLIS